MKSIPVLLLTMFAMPVACGAMSMSPENDIPLPETVFHASITDIDGIVTEGTNIAFNGHTFISGQRGSTEVYIPFERIVSLEVVQATDQKATLEVSLTDGAKYQLVTFCSNEFTGTASFGQFRIKLRHVQTLKFLTESPVPPPAD